MQKITVDNRSCLYLNHYKLIKSQYEQHDPSDSRKNCFTLKPEIFNFKPKTVKENSNQLKNKRKRKAETENVECMDMQPFLKEIQSRHLESLSKNLETMPRVWEESLELPQFRGANNTPEFQTTHFGQHSYIIPPKCKFYNYNVEDIPHIMPELETYDIIIMDMPWRNKYIKRLKKVKQSLAYKMLDNEDLKNIPIQKLIHSRSLVVLWCTNSPSHQKCIQEEFLPSWNLTLVHTLKWYKLNTEGDLISPVKSEGSKQPYEILYIACHKDRKLEDFQALLQIDVLASIPSIIHSHKPPLIDWLKEYLDDPIEFKGLEIFARYLQPQFTSIGLEVLKLMDKELYNSAQ